MTRKFIKSAIAISSIGIALCSCEDLTETDLTNVKMNLIAPVDSLRTDSLTNSFVWEEVKGTVKYQFQLASPKFDSVAYFVVDSSLTGHLLNYTLSPGTYQWRVKAINNSTSTAYFTRTIFIQ